MASRESLRRERRIGKLLNAIENIGISDSIARRLHELESDKRDSEDRLNNALIEWEPLDALPDLVPALVERRRALVGDFEGLATNPSQSWEIWTLRAVTCTRYSAR